MQMTQQDERMLSAMGITMEPAKDPHHDCMVRWLEEREEKDTAVRTAQQAWSLMDGKNAQIDALVISRGLLLWAATVGWLVAIVAVVIAIVR